MSMKRTSKKIWHIIDAANVSEMHRNDASHPERSFGRLMPPPTQEPATYSMLYRQF